MGRVTWKLTSPYGKQIVNGNLVCDWGNSGQGSVTTDRGGRKIQEGGGIGKPMADSCGGLAETSTIW